MLEGFKLIVVFYYSKSLSIANLYPIFNGKEKGEKTADLLSRFEKIRTQVSDDGV